jgi:hypothetical protein
MNNVEKKAIIKMNNFFMCFLNLGLII